MSCILLVSINKQNYQLLNLTMKHFNILLPQAHGETIHCCRRHMGRMHKFSGCVGGGWASLKDPLESQFPVAPLLQLVPPGPLFCIKGSQSFPDSCIKGSQFFPDRREDGLQVFRNWVFKFQPLHKLRELEVVHAGCTSPVGPEFVSLHLDELKAPPEAFVIGLEPGGCSFVLFPWLAAMFGRSNFWRSSNSCANLTPKKSHFYSCLSYDMH